MLNRPLTGLVTGAALGVLDGLSALLTSPEVSDQITGIVVGSTVKGLVAGLIVGAIARKFRAPGPGIGVGVVVASLVTLPIAYMNAAFLGDAPKIFNGPITVGKDGTMVSLVPGNTSVTLRELL